MFIEPRILKGFRDFLPPEEIARRDLVEKIERSFRSYGFVPIDTPALEYTEILLGKAGGETEKQIYRFNDNGGRDVALRFDLTVPFARFLAEHRAELSFPFRRYHISKVWRGENTQRGRYREFLQCDFDIVGSDTAASDFEILHIMRNTLSAVSGVRIHLNHRGIFNRFLSRLGLLEKSVEILRTVDKLPKIGREETLKLLSQTAAGEAGKVLDYIEIKGSFDETLAAMTGAAGVSPESERLGLIGVYMRDAGIGDYFILDPSITRGLDYYTGVVFETFLDDMPDIGSVCSGGRYDNLVGLYTSGESLGGVGASVGLDRLIAALEFLNCLETKASYARAAIARVSECSPGECQALAEKLRKQGIACEVFLNEEKLTKQFQAAEKKGIRWFIIPDRKTLILRDLSKRENQENLGIEEIITLLNQEKPGNPV
jgi:histidyl-tRNA synthetase